MPGCPGVPGSLMARTRPVGFGPGSWDAEAEEREARAASDVWAGGAARARGAAGRRTHRFRGSVAFLGPGVARGGGEGGCCGGPRRAGSARRLGGLRPGTRSPMRPWRAGIEKRVSQVVALRPVFVGTGGTGRPVPSLVHDLNHIRRICDSIRSVRRALTSCWVSRRDPRGAFHEWARVPCGPADGLPDPDSLAEPCDALPR